MCNYLQKGIPNKNMEIFDMSNAYIEHSIVINNFVAIIGSQAKNSMCHVFGDNVKYKWAENDNIPVIPDASINCDIKNRRATTFMGVPKFIMEVLSDSTEKIDRNEKKELYKKVEVAEYWIVNWRKKQIEIYILSPDESSIEGADYILHKTITNENKEDLEIVMFPNFHIDFDDLFNME